MGMIKQALAGVHMPDQHQQLQLCHPSVSAPVFHGSSSAQPWRKPPRARSTLIKFKFSFSVWCCISRSPVSVCRLFTRFLPTERPGVTAMSSQVAFLPSLRACTLNCFSSCLLKHFWIQQHSWSLHARTDLYLQGGIKFVSVLTLYFLHSRGFLNPLRFLLTTSHFCFLCIRWCIPLLIFICFKMSGSVSPCSQV